MILFVGSKEAGYFAEEEAKILQLKCQYIEEDAHIEKHAEKILNYSECQYLIYNIEQYIDSADIIVDWILKIHMATKAKSIIYAPGYNPQSEIITRLYRAGIKNFIFSDNLSEKKEDLARCVNGFYENYGYESRGISFDNLPTTEEIKEEKLKIMSKSIGVAGAISRIGTTTQCIQLCKYLLYMGYKPAYIQLNNHIWIESLIEAYSDVKHDKELGKAEYAGVDMYYKVDKIPEVLKMDYDFFIYDYGSYTDPGFSKISFLEKERQIFVVGSKPGEFECTYKVIESNFYNNCFYIYNFVPIEEQEELKKLMEDKGEYTFFTDDTRDPFVYSGNNMYSKILPLEQKTTLHKKRRFKRKKK